MKKNKVVIEHCPNFYKIKNYEFDSDDYISMKLISVYEDYIFDVDINDINNLRKIEELDKILGKYVEDYSFRKEIKKDVLTIKIKRDSNIIESIVNSLIRLFENYEDGYTRNIYFARWI